MLEEFGTVEASELDHSARTLANQRHPGTVKEAKLPDLSMFERNAYDLIALLDVLEHVPDDLASLRAIHRRLKPGGTLLLTVPANPWMWSAHDAAHHHFRRYTRGSSPTCSSARGWRCSCSAISTACCSR